MTIIKHELKLGKTFFWIWTLTIGLLLAMCVFLYPEMETQMNDIGDMFSSMGNFSTAFGMDKLNFGTFIGFYGIECGNILGLGGGFFSAICAIGVLCKEERDKTAEFLLTHPVSRQKIITGKLISVIIQIVAMNVIIFAIALISAAAIGEDIPMKELLLLHTAYLAMQLEFGGICFGISAFLSRSGMGIGLGITAVMYFLNIIANITEKAEFLKYITPYGYAESSDIISELAIAPAPLAVGIVLTIAGIAAAYFRYSSKDIT
ncbi:MAG: ABC transporter permease subunit [Oscillospiraceae bacterium]